MAILEDPAYKNHSEYISICIEMVINSPAIEDKATHAKKLYEYLATEGLTFVLDRQHFKGVAIKKAYRLKIECDDLTDLHNSINCFLTAVGSPLQETDEDAEYAEVDEVELEL